jgi:hypothetical protein
MKTAVKRLIRDEKGQTLILTLVLLVVGGLIMAPLLAFMSTGIIAGEVYERRAAELYAADAGVEDAIWKIQNSVPSFYPYEYPEPLIVNDKSVDITIFREDIDPTCEEDLRYQILSKATGTDGSSTTIEAYLSVSYLDLSALLDNAIISYDTIDIQPGNEVNGDVWLPDEEDLDNKGAINGTVKDSDDMIITWPEASDLSSYYIEDVEGAPDPGPSIDIKDLNPKTIGPWYREGNLAVDNTGDPATLVLEGTVYVAGNLEFQQPAASKNYTVNLNGNTIFAEGSITFPAHHVSISGSGCIIAVGDINFQPAIQGDDFVLVMSITGEVEFHPSGDFTGCIAGNTHVQLQPGCTINWISPEGKGLDYPMGVGDDDKLPPVTGLSILSWQIQ